MTARAVIVTAALLAAAYPCAARAEFGADLGGAQFSQRVVTEVVQRRAQVRALLACEAMRNHNPGQPPAIDWSRLPLSPPVGTAGPVPLWRHSCRERQ